MSSRNLYDLAWACLIFAIACGIFSGTAIGIIAYVRGELSWRDKEDA